MTDKLWKQTERAIAKRLGGERVGPSGRATADVLTDALAIEVKTRKTLPRWLLDAMAQATAVASDGRLPIVVLHQVGQRHDDDLVVLRLADFEGLAVSPVGPDCGAEPEGQVIEDCPREPAGPAEAKKVKKGYVEEKMIGRHGPYRYRRWREGGRLRSRYLGKVRSEAARAS